MPPDDAGGKTLPAIRRLRRFPQGPPQGKNAALFTQCIRCITLMEIDNHYYHV